MIKISKAPKILFIKGVFKKNCISDDIFEEKIMENIDSDNTQYTETESVPNNYVNYVKLPETFVNINTWPKTTNLLCWYCNQKFNTVPVFIPGVIEPISGKNKNTALSNNMSKSYINDLIANSDTQQFSISVTGVFSSFECAYSYIQTRNFTLNEKTEMINKLKLLYKLFYNKKFKDISYYPSPYEMEQYGGNLTPGQFNKKIEIYKV